MIQVQLKLKLTPRQERQLSHWLWHLAAAWNWSLRKVELDKCSRFDLINLLAGHGRKLGIPAHVLTAVASDARTAWDRCFKKIARKPRFKGRRNRLNSIPFPDAILRPKDSRISIPGIGRARYHNQAIPEGGIKCGRIVKRPSGWYLCLFIDSEPTAIPRTGKGEIGIDPGFNDLLTLSTGEKIEHPRELEVSALRLAQSQRGTNRRLAARVQERIKNQRKDRNHKLTRRLVSENVVIRFSKDNIKGISKRFGKSVASSGHYQMRQMLSYKSSFCGTKYDEPDSKKSTITCSTCGAESGPRGLAGLKVRHWQCAACGSHHDRDINSAVNALNAAPGAGVERLVRAA